MYLSHINDFYILKIEESAKLRQRQAEGHSCNDCAQVKKYFYVFMCMKRTLEKPVHSYNICHEWKQKKEKKETVE